MNPIKFVFNFKVFSQHFKTLQFYRKKQQSFCQNLSRRMSTHQELKQSKRLNNEEKDLLKEMVKSIVPPLDSCYHKGQAGRIGVIGGSKEYTGAPYFAAISALRTGADLVHVFCSNSASSVIKSYSPELIVHPHLDDENGVEEICKWLPRLHSVVIGPGLGRDEKILNTVKELISQIKILDIPMIIDADGLFMIESDVGMITKVPDVILTPNTMEFQRLYKQIFKKMPEMNSLLTEVKHLSAVLGNLTILCKGKLDIITDGENTLKCDDEGGPRRCGGQGDLLSGSLGAFVHWTRNATKTGNKNRLFLKYGPSLTAAYAAAALTRKCNQLALTENGRSTVTSDMIQEIHVAFQTLYEQKETFSQ